MAKSTKLGHFYWSIAAQQSFRQFVIDIGIAAGFDKDAEAPLEILKYRNCYTDLVMDSSKWVQSC